MSPSQKENQREETYFRLSVERGCYSGGPDTGCASSGGQRQDHLEDEDPQEASQQESHCCEQRQARLQVIDEVTTTAISRDFRARIGRPHGWLVRAFYLARVNAAL